jgi:hypothetical protein
MTIYGRRIAMAVLGLALLAWAAGARAQEVRESGRGSLSYKGLVSAVSQEREYDFRVRKDGGEVLTGPVRIEGVEGFTGGDLGDIDWQVSGSRVTGTMTKNGRRIATFEGTVKGSEIRGTFKTSAGSTGSWTAEAPAEQ